MSRQSILVSGGCGFIGTSFIASYLGRYPDATVRVLDSFVTGQPLDLGLVCKYNECSADECEGKAGVSLVRGDIRDYDTVEKCAQGMDCILHLAANTGVGPSVENPRLDMECNVIGTFNMLEAARRTGVKRFVFASSGAPAGEVEPPIHEELPPHPVSPYGASKLAGEGYCSAYARTFGVETVCLRFGNVYGPRSGKKSSVVAKFIRQALAGEVCTVYGDGTQTRDFLYIEDLVKAVIKALEIKGIGGETFQVATGHERTVHEAALEIQKGLRERGVPMVINFDSPRLGDVSRNYSDVTKAKTVLGWSTSKPFGEGIAETISYFLDGGNPPEN